jgi:hypothetical protein
VDARLRLRCSVLFISLALGNVSWIIVRFVALTQNQDELDQNASMLEHQMDVATRLNYFFFEHSQNAMSFLLQFAMMHTSFATLILWVNRT